MSAKSATAATSPNLAINAQLASLNRLVRAQTQRLWDREAFGLALPLAPRPRYYRPSYLTMQNIH
jgi:hypothetical protein